MVEKLEDILTRFGNKIANAGAEDKTGQGARPALLSDRHPIRDFFIVNIGPPRSEVNTYSAVSGC